MTKKNFGLAIVALFVGTTFFAQTGWAGRKNSCDESSVKCEILREQQPVACSQREKVTIEITNPKGGYLKKECCECNEAASSPPTKETENGLNTNKINKPIDPNIKPENSGLPPQGNQTSKLNNFQPKTLDEILKNPSGELPKCRSHEELKEVPDFLTNKMVWKCVSKLGVTGKQESKETPVDVVTSDGTGNGTGDGVGSIEMLTPKGPEKLPVDVAKDIKLPGGVNSGTGEGDAGNGTPGAGNGTPGTGNGTPGTGNGTPGTGNGTPGTGNGTPGTGDVNSQGVVSDIPPVNAKPENLVSGVEDNKPCKDKALQEIVEKLKGGIAGESGKIDVLSTMFEIAALKVALRTKQAGEKTFEEAAKKELSALNDFVKSEDNKGLTSQAIKDVYQKYGKTADVELLNKKFSKEPCYYQCKSRLLNEHASAYMLFAALKEKKSSDDLTGFTEHDAAAVWAVEKLRAHGESKNPTAYKTGSANGNLMNLSTRVSRYLGTIEKGLDLSEEEIRQKIDFDHGTVSLLVTKAYSELSEDLQKCLKEAFNCSTCESGIDKSKLVNQVLDQLFIKVNDANAEKELKGLKGRVAGFDVDLGNFANGDVAAWTCCAGEEVYNPCKKMKVSCVAGQVKASSIRQCGGVVVKPSSGIQKSGIQKSLDEFKKQPPPKTDFTLIKGSSTYVGPENKKEDPSRPPASVIEYWKNKPDGEKVPMPGQP